MCIGCCFVLFKPKTAYVMRSSDLISGWCSSDLVDLNCGIVLALGENERAVQHRLRVECQTLCIHFGCEAVGLDCLGEIGLQRFSMAGDAFKAGVAYLRVGEEGLLRH